MPSARLQYRVAEIGSLLCLKQSNKMGDSTSGMGYESRLEQKSWTIAYGFLPPSDNLYSFTLGNK